MKTIPRFPVAVLIVLLSTIAAQAESVRKLWAKRYDSPAHGEDTTRGVAIDGAGNVIVSGTSIIGRRSLATGIYTAKYASSDGSLLWERSYRGADGLSVYGAGVATDGEGNALVFGTVDYSVNDNNTGDLYVAKYAAADGATLWERRYDGPVGMEDFGYAMVVDAAGDVIVSGLSANRKPYDSVDQSYYTSYTAKYSGQNGKLLWERRGPPGSDPYAVAVNGSGDVAVTGSVSFDRGLFTARYAASDGSILWENRGLVTPNSTFGNSAAIDGEGNVVVAGSFNDQFYTARYAARDGRPLWEHRLGALGAISNLARSVAVDKARDVIVTGMLNDACYTAKYAARDGRRLWQHKLPNADPSFSAGGQALALDDVGNALVAAAIVPGPDQTRVYATIKYAGANGTRLWQRNKAWVGSIDNYPVAIAVAVGSVAVTGQTNNFEETPDFGTVKYIDGPTPLTLIAGDIASTGAMLHGAVNSNGFATRAGFEYGVDPALVDASIVSPVMIGSTTKLVHLNAPVVSLAPLTTYYFRTVAFANGRTIRGATHRFTTQNRMD